jgi:hypothetical protein
LPLSVFFQAQNYEKTFMCVYFANTDRSRDILIVDTSILMKSNMGQREYLNRLDAIAVG